jgi:hypothetical protein
MATIGENWKCPYCGHAQVLADERVSDKWYQQYVEGWKEGVRPVVGISAIVCANQECRELTLAVILGRQHPKRDDVVEGPRKGWTLLPPSSAKPQPDYIPEPIRSDYYEACAIRDLSPSVGDDD